MVSYLYRMPAGIPGEVSRSNQAVIEPQTIQAAGQPGSPTAYGVALVLDATSGNMRTLLANENVIHADYATPGAIFGFLVRPFPTNSSNEGLGVGAPNNVAGTACDVLKRGYMNVKLSLGTAAKDGLVFIRRVANGGSLVGDLEAAFDNTIVSAAKGGGNTGNGTVSAGPTVAASSVAKAGIYTVRFTAATTFDVTDPSGARKRSGSTGVAYSDDIAFTITAGGTPFVAGDGFDMTVVQRTQPIPGARFMGPADANNITEISYRIGA